MDRRVCRRGVRLMQGVDIVAQRFGWPEQTMRFVIMALGVGFFVTLVLAWYHGERGVQRVNGTELLILALLLAVGGGFLWHFASARTSRSKVCGRRLQGELRRRRRLQPRQRDLP